MKTSPGLDEMTGTQPGPFRFSRRSRGHIDFSFTVSVSVTYLYLLIYLLFIHMVLVRNPLPLAPCPHICTGYNAC